MRGLSGRTAVITGGASGFGAAYAVRLAEEGVRIAIADIGDFAAIEEKIGDVGSESFATECDVADPDSVATFAGQVGKDFGHVDILVNNAGIYPFKSFADMAFEEWRKVLSVNLDGMFHMTKAFLPAMREAGWGRIVNQTSSTFGMAVPNAVHYVASKMGVIGFTRALATEVGEDGVTVNAIAPGATQSPGMAEEWGEDAHVLEISKAGQAIKRTEQPEDLAGLLAFLASEESAMITGQTIVVNGEMVRI